MKILQLCKKLPYPLKDGEALAIHYMSRGYHDNGCIVDLLAFNTSKHYVEYQNLPTELSHYRKVKKVYLDTSIKPLQALKNFVIGKSYNIERFINSEFKDRLAEWLEIETYDVVQFETLYMLPYVEVVRANSKSLVCFRSHNMEYEIWNNLALGSSSILRKIYYKSCANRLRTYEKKNLKNYNILLPISKSDEEKYYKLGFKGENCLAPAGLDFSKYKSKLSPLRQPIKIGYIGSMDWKPNIEGINWFLNQVWPSLAEEYEELEFHLAGRNMPLEYASDKSKRLCIHGEVNDAIAFLNELDMVVVPLFSGSGIRIKILESLAMGKPVLSTPKGFEGIDITHGKDAFLFENKTELLAAVKEIQNNVDLAQVSKSARNLVVNNFGYKEINAKILATIKTRSIA